MANYRAGRVNEEVKRELAEIFRELKDPRIPQMVSITKAEVTPDLKYAKINVSIMGSEEQVKNGIKGLNEAKGFIRRELGRRLTVRAVPELTFILDDSIEYGARISKLLKDITGGESK